jgi:phosphoribosylformylglycinamidine synthase I
MAPKIGVVTFPGSLDDQDALRAIRLSGGEPVSLWHGTDSLDGVAAVILPGGFSYGDYLRCGAISRFAPVMAEVIKAAEAGMPILGICNGFQILCEAGLLPGALMRNGRLSFASRPVTLRVERTETVFTSDYKPGQLLTMPVAHGDGRFTADEETVRRIEREGLVIARYVGTDGAPARGDENPNDSLDDIAGICDPTGRIVGLMPHPDRAADPTLGNTDGLGFFTSMMHAAVGK